MSEVALRLAVGHITEAQGYIERTAYNVELDDALINLNGAIEHIKKYAEKSDIQLKGSMHT